MAGFVRHYSRLIAAGVAVAAAACTHVGRPEAQPVVSPAGPPPAPPVVPAAAAEPAEPPPALTLAALEAMAVAGNPTLAQAAAQVEAARGRALQAGLRPNPTVGYLTEQIGQEGTAGQQGVFVSQTFVRGGKLELARAKFDRETEVVVLQAQVQELTVRNGVRQRYWLAAVLRLAADRQDEVVRRADEVLRAVEGRAKDGKADHADVLEARQEKRQAEDIRGEIASRRRAAWRQLAALVGRPDLPPADLPADPEADGAALRYDDALARLLAESPELAVARAEAAMRRASVRRERAEPVPNVQVELATAYDFADRRQQAYAQVGWMLPAFDRNQGNVRAAVAECARAEAGVGRVELSLRERLAVAWGRYETARDDVRQSRDERVPAARQVLDLRLEGYRAGRGEWSQVQQALRAYAQAVQQYVQAVLHLRRAEAAIDGLLLVDGLDEPPPPPSQGQPLRNEEQKRLQDSLQESVVGAAGRGVEQRFGNDRPQLFGIVSGQH